MHKTIILILTMIFIFINAYSQETVIVHDGSFKVSESIGYKPDMDDKEIFVSDFQLSLSAVTYKEVADVYNWALESYTGFDFYDDELKYDGDDFGFHEDLLALPEESGWFWQDGKIICKNDKKNSAVQYITFYGALFFCNLKSMKEGFDPVYSIKEMSGDFSKNGYRLPTEAEWNAAYKKYQEFFYSNDYKWEFCWDKYKINNAQRWKNERDPYNLYFNYNFVGINTIDRTDLKCDEFYPDTGFRCVRSLPDKDRDTLGTKPKERNTFSIIPAIMLGITTNNVNMYNISVSFNITFREIIGFGGGVFFFQPNIPITQEIQNSTVHTVFDRSIGGFGLKITPFILGNRRKIAFGLSGFLGLHPQESTFIFIPTFYPYYAFTAEIYFFNFLIQVGFGDSPKLTNNHPAIHLGVGYSINF